MGHTQVPGMKAGRKPYSQGLTVGEDVIAFHRTVTITAAAAAVPVSILSDVQVPTGNRVFIHGFIGRVNGATPWTGTASVAIADTAGVPVATIGAAALTANARVMSASPNVTIEDPYSLGTGGTAGRGLQVMGNANGAGSDLVLTVWGIVR